MHSMLQVYELVLLVSAVGLTISTLEFWAIVPTFSPAGVHSGTITRLRFRAPRSSRLDSLMDRLFSEQAVRALLILRLMALGLALLAPLGSALFSAAMTLLVLNILAFNVRRLLGDDGSDQMTAIVLITVWLCVGPHSTAFIQLIGLWFIALQACLSYASAGIAKLISPEWRSGRAIFGIFNTTTYGHEWAAKFLRERPGLQKFLAWQVIVVESLFPLCLVLPEPWGWAFLGWGALFHLQCAAIMGLNSFFWAFTATYPAIVYVSATVG